MKTLLLSKANVGSHPNEVVYFELAKRFHECQMELSSERFIVWRDGNMVFSSSIELYEKDHLTTTYRGSWTDGKRFRIVEPSEELMPLYEALGKNILVIGSMFSDGYAVTFELTNASWDSSNKISFFHSLIQGNNNPSNGSTVFHSNTHQRYEFGKAVRREQIGCRRVVVIEKNISGGIGFSVTVNNPDAMVGSWGATPMGTKPMKVHSISDGKVELRGYGYDETAVSMGVPMSDATFENYGLTIFHDGQNITHCVIHMIERGVDIDYYIKDV